MKKLLLILTLTIITPAYADYLGCFEPNEAVEVKTLYLNSTGVLTDPTSPACDILDPNDTTLTACTSGPTKVGTLTGIYESSHTIPASPLEGVWIVKQKGTVDGSVKDAADYFMVVDVAGECPGRAGVKISDGTGAGQIDTLNGSIVNVDLSDTCTALTTNNDKTGYSLTQAFPTNFSSTSIDGSGRVLLQPTQTGVTIPTVATVATCTSLGANAVNDTSTNLTETLACDPATGTITETDYAANENPAELVLATPSQKLATDASGGVAVAGLSTAAKAEVQTEAEDALVAKNLDHLIRASTESTTQTSTTTNVYFETNIVGSNDQLNGMILGYMDAGGNISTRRIADSFTGTTGAQYVVVSPALVNAPTNGEELFIFNAAFAQVLLDAVTHTGAVIPQVDALGTQAKADVNTEATNALNTYDPPTRAEATSDKNEILARTPSATAIANIDDAYDGTGYMSSGIAVSPTTDGDSLTFTVTINDGVITADNDFVDGKHFLYCGNEASEIMKTVAATDIITVDPASSFGAEKESGTCYIK